MIEEQFVSFETARLLKEAGFDVPCTSQYSEGKSIWYVDYPYNFNQDEFGYSLPTQALAARWLREVHHINVYACFAYEMMEEGKRKWFFMQEDTMTNDDNSVYCSPEYYETYEAAMEAGIAKCLELIKK